MSDNGGDEVTDAADPPVSLEVMREELAHMDTVIADLVHRRTVLARRLGETRWEMGGTRTVHGDDLAVVRRFCHLPGGAELATMLLRAGRSAD